MSDAVVLRVQQVTKLTVQIFLYPPKPLKEVWHSLRTEYESTR